MFGLIAGVENTNYGRRFDIDDYLNENANVRADDKQIQFLYMMVFLQKIIYRSCVMTFNIKIFRMMI